MANWTAPTCPAPPLYPLAQNECVAQREARPAYKELEAVLRGVEWSMSSKPIGERLAYEARWTQKSLDPLPQQQKLDQ